MHQTGNAVIIFRILKKMYTLYQGRSAVAHADDGYPYFMVFAHKILLLVEMYRRNSITSSVYSFAETEF
jgi:hypothetical protein